MVDSDTLSKILSAVSLIRSAKYLTSFTGAGISVESGIPPFRGPGGLCGKYDAETLQIEYFLADPARAWPTIREIFYATTLAAPTPTTPTKCWRGLKWRGGRAAARGSRLEAGVLHQTALTVAGATPTVTRPAPAATCKC